MLDIIIQVYVEDELISQDIYEDMEHGLFYTKTHYVKGQSIVANDQADEEQGTSNVAFFDGDGHQLETNDGIVYTYTLTISIDGSNVNFKVDDDLNK